MKYLFIIVFLLLAAASVGVRMSFPDLQTGTPVIYWVTDKNPARDQQVAMFHQWLVKQGHVTSEGKPVVELRLDMANRDETKQIIQSVSGVGGDLMDTSGSSMYLFEAMGTITDITDAALEKGFGPAQTFPTVEPEISVNGRQYRYPANVAVTMLWVNPETFRRFGLEPPPKRWTWDEFERRGLEFIKVANPEGTRPADRRFFAVDVPTNLMLQSAGLSEFNETMTACALNDPRYVKMLETKRRWVYDLHLLPTPDDRDAMVSQQGYGGASLQLFSRGQYAMVPGGRWLLIQFRRFENLGKLQVVELPNDGFPSTTIRTRAVVLYKGSKHPELAKLFLEFLASEDYNRQVVADADALPPNPAYTHDEAFLHPPDYPNEWDAHGVFAETANTIAVPGVYSPYLLPSIVRRMYYHHEDAFMNRQHTAEETAQRLADEIDTRMADELSRKPHLQEAYDRDVATQEKIDALKEQGKPIPLEWITNPFYRVYYRRTGQLAEPAAASALPGSNPPSAPVTESAA